MSANDIAKMDFKQLRNEVQMLRDELAMMQRKYEDILYNLDDDNFSGTFLREKDGMKTAIKVNAEGLESKVSNEDFESTKTQLSSEIKQTANGVKSTVRQIVTDEYITDALGDTYVENAEFDSKFEQKANGIFTEVSAKYETKDNASQKYSELSGSISSMEQTAEGISSKVQSIEGGTFGEYTLFEQTADKFKFIGNVEMSGNAIVGGTISGAIFANDEGTHTLELGNGSTGVFRLYNQYYDSEYPYFYIFDDTYGSISMGSISSSFLRVSAAKTIDGTSYSLVKPIGTWDFTDSDCTLILPDGIGGGGSGSLADGNLVIKTTGSSTNDPAVNFYAFGEEDINNFMGYNEEQKTLYAKGTWDFEHATVNNLAAKFA